MREKCKIELKMEKLTDKEIEQLIKQSLSSYIKEEFSHEKQNEAFLMLQESRKKHDEKYKEFRIKNPCEYYKEGDPQKFQRGQEVKVDDVLCGMKMHFAAGFNAIIIGSAHELYNSGKGSYSLLILENGLPKSSVSWYEQHELTLVNSDEMRGNEILKIYNQSK